MSAASASRREFLRASVTVSVAFALPTRGWSKPVALDEVDSFLAIGVDGRATLYTGKVELGQGIRTALAQMAAEELDLPFEAVRVVEGDTDLTPAQGLTGGSVSIQLAGQVIRRAAATARAALVRTAAAKWGVQPEAVTVADGRCVLGDRSFGFGELAAPGSSGLKLDPNVGLKAAGEHRVIGQSIRRVDVADKVRGRYVFVQDVERPGMIHARVLRPSAVGATLQEADDTAARRLPRYLGLVRVGSFLAVTARDEWTAVRAAGLVKARWSGGGGLPAGRTPEHIALTSPVAKDEVVAQRGQPDAELAARGGPLSRQASYSWPMQTHGSIGPSCAVAEFRDGRLTCWTASQATHDLRRQVAQWLELRETDVRMIYVDGAGCYGRNGHEDCTAEAPLLARQTGRPVRVQWMRQDEHGWDPKGPITLHRQRGAVDARGRIAVWASESWVPFHEVGTVPLLPAAAAGAPGDGKLGVGLMKNNSDPPYQVEHLQAVVHQMAAVPLRASWIRTPGRMQNAYAVESFMDELAAAAGQDPVAFRLAHLADPRGRAVIEQGASAFGWSARPSASGAASRGGVGQGMAYLRYNNNGTYVAAFAQVRVDAATGKVKAERFVVAHDCGLVINPDGIRQNVEGNVLQTVSRVLLEELGYDRQSVTSLDWASYPIARFSDMPALEVVVINRPDVPPTGAGEPSAAAVPAAIANAIHDATGARVRDVPFKPAVVLAAMRPTRAQG